MRLNSDDDNVQQTSESWSVSTTIYM